MALDKNALFYACMELFVEKGVRTTMDDVSRRMGISKRTLYQNIRSKEELADFLVTRYFEIVEEVQRQIREDASLDPVEKVRRLLTATPSLPLARFRMTEFRVEYPQAYALLDEKLSRGWEKTFVIMDECIAAGRFRPFNKELFARVYASAIEGLTLEFNQQSGMTFDHMQAPLVQVLLFGIVS